ncbi:MAG: stage V sporulation protein SpoVR [Armatimonadaceae bacterium]
MLTHIERGELERSIEEIWELALSMGYDPYPIHFEVVPVHVIYELGSYSLPARYSHWTFGRDYHRQKTSYEYGYSKIYEIVFNTDPCQAFLMDSNSMLSHKLTIAHVIGHCHFFKHNTYFAHTDRKMIEKVRLHRDRIAQYEQEHGWREVENFLDAVMCVDEHIDPTSPMLKSGPIRNESGERSTGARTSDYDDLWNLMGKTEKPRPKHRKFPEEPEKDLLLFLATYSRDLEDWQRDIISMMREEMLYFLPQIRTKIMNEGFASLAHERILEQYLTKPEEIWEFRRLHSGVLSPSPAKTQINPYYVGFQILKDIERRWNGEPLHEEDEPETDWLGTVRERPHGEGWQKIFEVCEDENDVTFLRKYLTEPLVKRLDMYTYKREEVNGEEMWVVETTDWEQVRDTLLETMTNFGRPVLFVDDGDYGRRGELYLKHAYDGKPLDVEYTEKTLRALYKLWGRPVHLESVLEDEPIRFSFDGNESSQQPA